MKRVLQGLALLQLFLIVALGYRLVDVWTTPLPEFSEIPELPALVSLPPPRPATKISKAITDGVVEHDLFDDERGQGQDDSLDGIQIDEAPIPPPSTVKLMGVMLLGEEPIGILLDTNVQPEQQSVRKGEMFGEYEVGDISASGLLLLGGGGQQFQVPLRIDATGAVAAPVAAAAAAGRPAPAARGNAARPANQRNDAAAQKAQSARERAQAIAERNAAMRKNGQRTPPRGEAVDEETDPDPVQARLEALRALREAAKTR